MVSEVVITGLLVVFLSALSLIASIMIRDYRKTVFVIVSGILSLVMLFVFSVLMCRNGYVVSLGSSSDLALTLSCDTFSLIVLLNIVIIGITSLMASYRYMEIYNGSEGYVPYYFMTLVFIYSMALLPLTRNWLWFLLFFEIMTLASYFLVGYEFYEEGVARIAWNYFVLMHVLCSLPLIVAVSLTYTATGTFEFTKVASGATTLIAILYLVGFATKSGLFPVHFWLPDAHPVAPSPISALLSGAMVEIGVYGMYRVLEQVVGVDSSIITCLIIVVALLSTIAGVSSYIRQKDIKRLFAWSTIDNMGWMYLLLAISGGSGGLVLASYILNHGLAKAAAFICSGLLIYVFGTRRIDDLRGSYVEDKLAVGLLIMSMFALEGVPPFNFFWNKFAVVRIALEYNVFIGVVYALLWCIAFVVFLYVIHQLISGNSSLEKHVVKVRSTPNSMVLAILVLLGLLLFSQFIVNSVKVIVGG